MYDSVDTLCIYNIPLKKQVFQFQSLYTYPNDSIAIQGLSCMYFNETEQELYTGTFLLVCLLLYRSKKWNDV